MRSGNGESHAKIILIGEHSVVYEQPAIALPLSKVKTKVHIKESNEGRQILHSRYFDGELLRSPASLSGIKHLINYILDAHSVANSSFVMTITSDLPAERGMGSSAAAAIAVVRALYAYFGWHLTHSKLLQLANIAEKDIHGNPSGLDAATSASSQPVWMIKNKELFTLPLKLNACLLICDSGIKGRTGEAVASVKKRMEIDPETTQTLIDRLGKLAFAARTQIANDDSLGLGKTFNLAQAQLATLGVSNKQLDELIKTSLALGALGSKLTGGGRGGCFISLVKNQKTANKIAQQLRKKGVTETWIQPLGNH
ncbi:mevalonate kinase [Liquorilactobacillus aquaticus DSM 21051]|uniref:Mevalonate kinase n=1 Tax=Liquorilactobacillus aquaticus DSM 21051 TaxID=1423725 RepID=A0A0R2D1X3_9LACO|nr:mevalonate kinase [Liquorilactobacillus aquaticus]KRM97506.1 mevalonate kinase [Liquorilactobacillus aquaticus DSM 21051]